MPPKNAKWVSKLTRPAKRRVRRMSKMLKLTRMFNVMLLKRIRALKTQMQNIADSATSAANRDNDRAREDAATIENLRNAAELSTSESD
eukprot:227436-Pyramimonas_sp.AAC.1